MPTAAFRPHTLLFFSGRVYPRRSRRTGARPVSTPRCQRTDRYAVDHASTFQRQLTRSLALEGSGKTAIFTSLIRYLPPLVHPRTGECANRVLVIVSSIQLATQTAEVVRRTYPGMSVEVEQGNKKATGLAQVTVATYQVRTFLRSAFLAHADLSMKTLSRGDGSRLDKFDPDYFKAVIVDEVLVISLLSQRRYSQLLSIGPSFCRRFLHLHLRPFRFKRFRQNLSQRLDRGRQPHPSRFFNLSSLFRNVHLRLERPRRPRRSARSRRARLCRSLRTLAFQPHVGSLIRVAQHVLLPVFRRLNVA